MATKVQRAVSILNALADPNTVTNVFAGRVANAFVYTYRRDLDPAALTNEQKAGIVIRAVRDYVKQVVRDAEISQAMEATRVTTAPTAEIDIGTDGDI